MIIDIPESSMSCHGGSILGVDCNQTAEDNGVLSVAKCGKRPRSHARKHRHKRRKLSSQNTCDTNCSLADEKVIRFPVLYM